MHKNKKNIISKGKFRGWETSPLLPHSVTPVRLLSIYAPDALFTAGNVLVFWCPTDFLDADFDELACTQYLSFKLLSTSTFVH